MLILSNIAFASTPNRAAINQSILNAYSGQISCKTNATVTFISEVIAVVPNSSRDIGPLANSLKQDSAQTQLYANSGNINSFTSYVTGVYDPQIRSTQSLLTTSLRSSIVNRSTLSIIKSDYNSVQASYQQCTFNSLKLFANDRIEQYNDQISAFQHTIAKLNSNGVATAGLNETLQSANSTIIAPLQNAVNSASNSTQIRNALNSYCLFDGCTNGTNFHLDARMATGILSGILDKATTLNITKNQTATLDEAQGNLTAATDILQTVGTSPYTPTQETQLWADIQSSAMLLRHSLTGK